MYGEAAYALYCACLVSVGGVGTKLGSNQPTCAYLSARMQMRE